MKSCGIILLNKREGETYVLLVRRKDSFGYVDFLRGNYLEANLTEMFERMTKHERNNINTLSFDELWHELWKFHDSSKPWHAEQKQIAKDKFYLRRWRDYLNIAKDSVYDLPELGFCKGRINKNTRESELECAVRELEEETGYKKDQIKNIRDIGIEESSIGNNGRMFHSKYFIAELKDSASELPTICPEKMDALASEISGIYWVTIDEALQLIRPYESIKLSILESLKNV